MQFDFKIKYKLKENNSANRLSWKLDYAKGFKMGDSK
jgi:hypothetical protein